MGIVLKDEHLLADLSAMMSLELRRHFNYLKSLFTPHVPTAYRTFSTRMYGKLWEHVA